VVASPVLALYRRYRPDTFADVIGQDHVVRPLTAALVKGRVNHAYLFSGPRGCGKTTSARVLARSLNCTAGPTATPCGECDSCRDLARGGPGSLDVIEIDAASHRGIDDARDLRERVTFAPVRDQYKVVIIDEAHQITNEGFNALLKVVEEPPDHVVFVFATTEPEKVLGTIRSRTHHYPFRLVPPRQLLPYLQSLCEREGVTVTPGALSLVVRAGGGSVRDTLSVLDQLVAGAGPEGVDVDVAGDLLGYVPDNLLDDMVAALAAVDGAAAFGVVHRAVEGGHDPRRFAHDLLERLRTLVLVSRVGDAAADLLPDLPPDAVDRLRTQAGHLGPAELGRAADTVAGALADMAGATPPRLLLELLVARLLVVGGEAEAMTAARLDRLERQVALLAGGAVPAVGAGPGSPPARAASTTPPTELPPTRPGARQPSTAPQSTPSPAPAAAGPRPPEGTPAEPVPVRGAALPRAAAPSAGAGDGPPAAGSGGITVEAMRRSWDAVLDELRGIKRFTWTLVSQEAQVLAVDAQSLTLGFAKPGLVETFTNRGQGAVVREALLRATGVDRTVVATVDRRAEADGGGPGASPAPDPGPGTPPRGRPGSSRDAVSPPPVDPGPPEPPEPSDDPEPPDDVPSRRSGAAGARPSSPAPHAGADADGAALVRRMLGGQIIEETHGA
jgi:DNA polymerase-3 subunit gamma/tau